MALLVVLPAGRAAAHTALLGSSPAPGERLAYTPEEVLLSFADPVDPATLTVDLRTAEGTPVVLTPLAARSGAVTAVAYDVPRLARGVYGLTWESVGDDGHRARGEVLFGVGIAPAGAAIAAVPADPVAVGLDLVASVARIIWYLALGAAAAVAVLGRAERVLADRVKAVRSPARLALAGAAVLRGGVGAAIVLQAGGGVERALWPATATWVLLALGLAWAARQARRRPLASVDGGSGRDAGRVHQAVGVGRAVPDVGAARDWWVLGLAVLVGTLAGHAPDRPDPVLAVVFGVAHVGAAAVWVGPLLAVALAARSRGWRDGSAEERAAALRSALAAVVPAAVWALVVVLGSGGLLAARALDLTTGLAGAAEAALGGSFGWVLLAKSGVVLAVVLPLGALHHRRRARMEALPRTWRVEAAGLVVALVLGSVLVGVDPGWGGPVGGADQALTALLDGEADDPAACAALDVGRAACTRTALTSVLLAEGPQTAIEELEVLSEADDYVAANCHQVAHDLGNDAAERIADMADALAVEASVCWSGYYHGFVEARLAAVDDADLARDLPTFCDGAADPAYSFTHYNCVHGLGHGVMLRVGDVLFDALPMCEQMDEEWAIRSCASGVFMENVMAAQQGIEDVVFDDADLLYPCTAIEGAITEDCYLMQTSYILWRLEGDVAGAFAWCDTAPQEHQPTCYRSMGRDISSRALLDVDAVVAECSLGRPDLVAWCYDGAASNAVYETAATDAADELCGRLESIEAQRCGASRDQAAAIITAG